MAHFPADFELYAETLPEEARVLSVEVSLSVLLT